MEIINKYSSIKQYKIHNITSRIKFLRDYQKKDLAGMQYSELQFILNDKNIKIYLIKIYLEQIYAGEYNKIKNDWCDILKDQKIFQDYNKIKEKYISQQWIEENVNVKKLNQKQQKYTKFSSPLKNNNEVKQRLKIIEDEMKIIENKIIMTKDQSQNLLLIKKYNELKQQWSFCKNKKKKLKQINREKQLTLSISKSTNKIQQIYERICQIERQQERIKHIKNNRYNLSNKQLKNDKKNQKFIDKLNLLQNIFNYYSKQSIKQKGLFQNIQQHQKYITLQNYLRLLSDNGIDNLLSLEEKVVLFKKQSKYHKKVAFLQFSNILKSLCQCQCQKLNIQFTSSNLQNFLSEVIKKFNSNKKHFYYSSLQKGRDNSLRTPIKSKYHFKIQSHTGKFQGDIQQIIKQRNNLKLPKTQLSCSLERSSMNRSKFNIKLNNNNNYNNNNKKSKYYTESYNKQDSYLKDSHFMNTPLQVSRINALNGKPTYLDMFVRKKKANYNKFMIKKQWGEDEKSPIITPNFNIIEVSNKQKEQQKMSEPKYLIKQDEMKQQQKINELKDLIEQDQSDPFLTNHLSHKYSLDSSLLMKL